MHDKSKFVGMAPTLSMSAALTERRREGSRTSVRPGVSAGVVVTLLGPSVLGLGSAPSNEPPDLTA